MERVELEERYEERSSGKVSTGRKESVESSSQFEVSSMEYDDEAK